MLEQRYFDLFFLCSRLGRVGSHAVLSTCIYIYPVDTIEKNVISSV
jgi:hypothetical protein